MKHPNSRLFLILTLVVTCLIGLLTACSNGVVIVVTATPIPVEVTATPEVTKSPSATPTLTPMPTATARVTATATEDPTPTQEVGFRIGYNINGQAVPNWAYLWQHLEAVQPSSLLFMDNIAAACEAARRLPDTVVIHRDYSGHEGNEWSRRPDAQSWIARWRDQGCLEVVRYTTNEPSLHDLVGFLASEVRLMDAAAAAGIRLSVGNFGVGMLPDWAISAGMFDAWLRAVARGNHIIGAHEYTTGILPFGVGAYSRQQLLNPVAMQPDRWVTQLPIRYLPFTVQAELDPATAPFGLYEQSQVVRPIGAQNATQCVGSYPPYWHILRTTWLLLRAECIGLNMDDFTIINTEGLWDNLSDIDVPEIAPIQTWRQRYGLDRYMYDMRGIPTYERLWAAYFPQWTPEEAVVCQLKWWDYIAPEQYQGVTLFTWSTNTMWIPFDVSGVQAGYLYELHELIEFWAEGGDMRTICGNYAWAA